jgi:hypothetical protein
MDDYLKRNEELNRLQRQELERRTGEWNQELLALQETQRGERSDLQQDLAAEDRRLKNRLLDLVVPARQRTRHEIANSALDYKHATERDHVQHQALQERDQIDARYTRARKQLDRDEQRRLENQESTRTDRAEQARRDIEKRELFARYFPAPEQDRSPDKERDRGRER